MNEQQLAQQWRITQPDDQTGQAVLPRTHYGLRNLVVERSLRYGERSFGINLRWLKDKESQGCRTAFEAVAKTLVEKGIDFID